MNGKSLPLERERCKFESCLDTHIRLENSISGKQFPKYGLDNKSFDGMTRGYLLAECGFESPRVHCMVSVAQLVEH